MLPIQSEVRRIVDAEELFGSDGDNTAYDEDKSVTEEEAEKQRRKRGRAKSEPKRKKNRKLRENLSVGSERVLVKAGDLREGYTLYEFLEVGQNGAGIDSRIVPNRIQSRRAGYPWNAGPPCAQTRIRSPHYGQDLRLDNRKEKAVMPPQGATGKAITYAENQWESLCVYLTGARTRLDNNLSENALRIIAIGRKNFLFVGHEEAGQNLAILQTITSACRLHHVDAYEYIKDVLIRIQTHTASKIDELLPPKLEPYHSRF